MATEFRQLFFKSIFALLGFIGVSMSPMVLATLLTAKTNVDNGYQIYISTSDLEQGVLFGSGNSRSTTFTDTTTLQAGIDYFLHIYGYDQGGVAGMIGDFSLSGSDHRFANALTTLSSGPFFWSGSNLGWGGGDSLIVNIGPNGVSPWGSTNTTTISPTAGWIWVGDSVNQDVAYFSTKIYSANSPIPEPPAIFLLCLGAIGLIVMRKTNFKKIC